VLVAGLLPSTVLDGPAVVQAGACVTPIRALFIFPGHPLARQAIDSAARLNVIIAARVSIAVRRVLRGAVFPRALCRAHCLTLAGSGSGHAIAAGVRGLPVRNHRPPSDAGVKLGLGRSGRIVFIGTVGPAFWAQNLDNEQALGRHR
jgi:hypothetical protein